MDLNAEPSASDASVMNDEDLVGHIVGMLASRDCITLQCINRCFRGAVMRSKVWTVIDDACVNVELIADPRPAASYQQGAVIGNRLCKVIRQFGHRCRKLDLRGALWLHATGLEDVGR